MFPKRPIRPFTRHFSLFCLAGLLLQGLLAGFKLPLAHKNGTRKSDLQILPHSLG